MEVYEAIRQMRILSENGGCFSMTYASYSMSRNTSEGVIEVAHARLSKNSLNRKSELEDLLLHYTDLDTGDHRQMYGLLLLSFNNVDLILK